jgi:putative sterol carrier protein
VAVRAFFESLESRGGSASLDGIDRVFRFEIDGEGTWLVAVRGGRVTVSEGGDGAADATVRASGEVFERIVSGKQNPAAAYMTGKVKIDGDLSALLKLQALFG